MSSLPGSKQNDSMVGISEIGVAIPDWYIKAEEIAKERDLPPEYVNGGLGLNKARIPFQTSLEDLITEAVRKIKYQDVERFFIGTESDYDLSKAAVGIDSLNRKLSLSVVPFQPKFACLGGIQSLLSACEYALAHKKPAIVIVADRSIYDDKKAEVTQGSGAVALRIETGPSLLEIKIKRVGQFAQDIDDFRVPARTAPIPEVDGPLTKPAFIKCVLEAFQNYKDLGSKKSLLEEIDFLVMHTPFPKMVTWTAAAIWHYEKEKDKDFLSSLSESLQSPSFFSKFKERLDRVRENTEFQEFFLKKVAPGLEYNPQIGNCYNASIFLSLISVLEKIKSGQRVLILGYGSGAGSLVFAGQAISQGFTSGLKKNLQKGRQLDKKQYLEWRNKIIKSIREK
ncbi:MAG: hypothetical protein GF370_03050 [Candidatus Nealsonbacteria bacterium]|nr:hypothetical protein [Candidatus Nealsonbacteria bacterium]